MVDKFRQELLKGLGDKPVHRFQFHKFSHPTKAEQKTRRDRAPSSSKGNRKNKKTKKKETTVNESRGESQVDFRLTPFDHVELENLDNLQESGRYIIFTVFHANLNKEENRSSHMYILGALQNVAMCNRIYPGWVPVIYIDETSYRRYQKTYDTYIYLMLKARPDALIILVSWTTKIPHHKKLEKKYNLTIRPEDDLASLVAQMKDRSRTDNNTKLQFLKTMWRFFPSAYRCTAIYRDTDSRVNIREAMAVEEWVNSGYPMHRIFDSVFYANPILAGLWGSKPNCPHVISSEGYTRECDASCAAIPNLLEMMNEFFTSENMIRGYGIDELFLSMEDKILQSKLYTDIMTHGYGAFFSSVDKTFTLFKNKQSLKLGRRMNSLMPCKGPVFEGYKKAFRELPSGSYIGFDVSFVGENLVMDWTPEGWISLIVAETMAYAMDEKLDQRWDEKLKLYRIPYKRKAGTFEKDLRNKSIEDFTDFYGFDKRFLPQFWYCFDRVLMHEAYTFTRIFTTNPSEYEVRVWEDAYRFAAREHRDVYLLLSKRVSNEEYFQKFVPKLLKLHSRQRNFRFEGKSMGTFFGKIFKFIEKHSHVLKYLPSDLKEQYMEGALTYYPFSALRQFNLEF